LIGDSEFLSKVSNGIHGYKRYEGISLIRFVTFSAD
jgi:hypothetical protein